MQLIVKSRLEVLLYFSPANNCSDSNICSTTKFWAVLISPPLGQTKLISWFTDPAGPLFIECKKNLNLGVASGGCGSQLNEWAW